MLYKKNEDKKLKDELFKNPTAEYRGAPFWAWNDELKKDELARQIYIFKEMGLGGFFMHVRTGLKNQYLSDEFMSLVKFCADKAEKNEMLAWAYDEDRWPSGAAGGLVTKDEKYRARCLLFSNSAEGKIYEGNDSASLGGRSENGKLLRCYDITLNGDGTLKNYKTINEDDEAEGEKWYAFLEISRPSSWYNNQTYVDTLSKEAIEKFVEITHERYKETVGDRFGGTVPAIFTDEPQFTRKTTLKKSEADSNTDVAIPWTDKVPELYKETYGEDILDTLPEVFWELPDGKVSLARYRYHDFIAELFASSFADTVGKWCNKNGLALTGHMMEECSLRSQTAALGETMRSYRSFGIPGIDMLCDSHEFTTAKQAQSASHQLGKEGVLSELYGVTGWEADFRLYKHQGDWQAALGVTVRVPHLSWYSMRGEAKRDYPASISYQSAWHTEWRRLEDHFARVNTAMTRGKPKVKIGVIHPVESFWLHWGPEDLTGDIRQDLDERFINLTKWLIEGSLDFDFISESLLPDLCSQGDMPLTVGEMKYDTIIVPGNETLRSSTLERLEKFKDKGGNLVFLGEAPTLENAIPSDRGRKLYNRSIIVPFEHNAVLNALKNEHTVEIKRPDGRLSDEFIYQLREDNDCLWLFIVRSRAPEKKDLTSKSDVTVTIKGIYSPVLYNTQNGEISPLGADYGENGTIIKASLYGYDSMLIKLTNGRTETPAQYPEEEKGDYIPLRDEVKFERCEKNVLLLDMAEYALDGEEFRYKEEILRLDNILRRELGFKERGGHVAQPWTLPNETTRHTVSLRFKFNSEITVASPCLALEDADKAEIVFNGEKIDNKIIGKYIDTAIDMVKLPDIKQGENVLTVTLPFGERTNTESMYILGDFGVKAEGEKITVIAEKDSLYFGSITGQGYPFYGGPLKYHLKIKAENGEIRLHVPNYRGGLIKVLCDGKEEGVIIYPPYNVKIRNLAPGEHDITLELLSDRHNTFGALHLVDQNFRWLGPNMWRTDGDNFSYSYVFRPEGILKAPEIII